MRTDWTPDHFVAEGKFCPTSCIRQWLEDWRVASEFDWILLLPFSSREGDTSFGSLMVICHQSAEVAASLQREVIKATTQASAQRLAFQLRTTVEQGEKRTGYSRIVPSDADELRQAEALRPLADARLLSRHLALFRPRTWSTKSGVRFVVLSSDTRKRFARSDGESQDIYVARRDDLASLQTMLNATRQAVLHLHDRSRPWRTGRRRRDRADVSPSIDDYLPVTDARYVGAGDEYDDLLEEASSYRSIEGPRTAGNGSTPHRSSHRQGRTVAIYFLDRTGERLRRVVGIGIGTEGAEIDRNSEESSIAFVLDKNRPPRIMNRVQSEPILHSSLKPGWIGTRPEPADFSEIVVPISSTAVGARPDVVGALVVQKRSPKTEVLDARDLAYYEQLAYRISLRRANQLFSDATAALAELTGNTMLASAGARDLPRLGSAWGRLPIDFANARPFFDRTLKLLYRNTSSTGASLALFDVAQERLVRIVEVGEGDLVPDGWKASDHPPGLAGLTNYALQHFETAHVRDTRGPGAFRRFGGRVSGNGWGSVRSAIVVPVIVADRATGVVIVGSTQPQVLTASTNFVQAAAQQIALSIMLAQRAEERRAFAYASSTAVHAHEILKRLDALREYPSEDIRRIGNEIHSLVDSLRSPGPSSSFMSKSPVDAFNDAIRDITMEDYVVWEGAAPSLPPVPPITVMAIHQAATEIFKNSKANVVSDGEYPAIRVRAKIVKQSPLPRLRIDIQHCIAQPLARELIPLLYRAPIEDPAETGRRHYGTFIAGYWLRAIGGDAYLWRTETDRKGRHWIGTALEVPLLTLAPEEVVR